MKISEFSVRRRVTTLMVFSSLVLLGVIGLRKVPLEFMPKIDMPFINIWLPYEGASPVEISDTIVEPIEEAISTMHGIKKIRSRCHASRAEIGVELSGEAKTDYLVLEIQERIDQIRNQLPEDLGPIMIMKFDTEQMPVIFSAVGFPEEKEENNDLIERLIIRPLRTIDGIANVQVEGMEEKRIKVEVDQGRLDAYHVSVLQIYNAILTGNLNLSAGSINHLDKKHSLRIVGGLTDLDEIRKLRVTPWITVGDVATVGYEYFKQIPFYGRMNQRKAYMLLIQKEAGANTVDVCRRVNAKIGEILKEPLLKGVEIKTWFDQSEEITRSLKTLRGMGLAGGLLAFLVLLLFLWNWRSTLIVSVAIPMSLITVCALMYFLKLSFNMVTIAALMIAIGMLVDNSIVVLEAIFARMQKGVDRVQASIKGTDEVGLAITVSTTTTIIVFLPLIFMGQTETSIVMVQLGAVVAIAIAVSLLVSLTLIPLLTSRFLILHRTHYPRWYNWLSRHFLHILDWSMDHRGLALLACLILFVLSFSAFFVPGLIEKEALPKEMMRMVQARIQFDRNPPLEERDEKAKVLEQLFMDNKEEWHVDTVAAIISDQVSRVHLVLEEKLPSGFTADTVKGLAKDLLAKEIVWPGVEVVFDDPSMGGPHGGGMSRTTIKVRGDDPAQVYAFAEQIRERLKAVKVIKEIKPLERAGKQELHIEIDRELARKYRFDIAQVAMAVSYSIRGNTVGRLTTHDRQLDIYMQLEEADRKSLAQLEKMSVENLDGEFILLKNFARFRIQPIPESIRRENRRFTVRIPINPAIRDLGVVRSQVQAALVGFRLPRGYSWVMGEEYQEMIDTIYTLLQSMLLAIALVFIVMTAQFESFFLPFVVIFTFPFALIGVAFFLIMTGSTFNALSGAGCLLLVGIVVNNAIVLVDHIHNLRKQGLGERDSLMRGAQDRLRPIMMTALTTIMGLLPMALGLSDTARMMYSPLAIAVLGGLVSSTFFTPLIIPLIYSLTDDAIKFLRQLWKYATT
jgi:HAE1 family hydrophobic/amphiphilic exporter-1